MFERRLKIFLGILLGVMSILLLRAVHLQVLTRSTWTQAAEEFRRRPVYVETTRGRILDHNGVPIAVDEACLDAAVDYRAISRDEKWIQNIATARVIEQLGGRKAYDQTLKAQRGEMVAVQVRAVNGDIDRMFALLAEVDGRPLEEIEDICHAIVLKVSLRSRVVQYRRYEKADEKRSDDGPAPWYRRLLLERGESGPSIDDFEQEYGEAYSAHPIVRNISQDVYARLAKEAPRCPGLVLQQGTIRRYPHGTAGAHLLGMLSPVTATDLEADPNAEDELRRYGFTDRIGRSGIEGLAEQTLRGARGKVYRQSDRKDEVIAAAVPGQDVKTTIDIHLQGELQRMFVNMKVPSNRHASGDTREFDVAMHGAIVVIDIKSGKVRALASYPDYDANELMNDYAKVAARVDDAPLLNRATQSQLEPGSTIKPVVGISAITQGMQLPGIGVLTAHSGIECTGYLVIDGRVEHDTARCWVASMFSEVLQGDVAHHPIPDEAPHVGTHGNPDGFLTLADALERSCNVYFETLGDKLRTNGLSYWFRHWGLGRETGLGIPEARGFLPDQVPTDYPSVAWFSAIGQSGVLATPIQMANVAATIARDGVWVRPRLIEGDHAKLPPPRTREGDPIPDNVDLKLSKEALAAAREGMMRVVNSRGGTGRNALMTEIVVAGKTGTAQGARIFDPKRDEKGQIIYLNVNDKRVDVDADGYIVADDHSGKPHRVDAQGNLLVLNTQKQYQRLDDLGNIMPLEADEVIKAVKGRTIPVERPLASADVQTPWPWYRGWDKDGETVSHGWFIGFAPADDPQVAFAVMIEYAESGGFAAQVATEVLKKCIERGYVNPKPAS